MKKLIPVIVTHANPFTNAPFTNDIAGQTSYRFMYVVGDKWVTLVTLQQMEDFPQYWEEIIIERGTVPPFKTFLT